MAMERGGDDPWDGERVSLLFFGNRRRFRTGGKEKRGRQLKGAATVLESKLY